MNKTKSNWYQLHYNTNEISWKDGIKIEENTPTKFSSYQITFRPEIPQEQVLFSPRGTLLGIKQCLTMNKDVIDDALTNTKFIIIEARLSKNAPYHFFSAKLCNVVKYPVVANMKYKGENQYEIPFTHFAIWNEDTAKWSRQDKNICIAINQE